MVAQVEMSQNLSVIKYVFRQKGISQIYTSGLHSKST